MGLNKAKGRMFKSVGWTWNPCAGCTHNCLYCYAKNKVNRRPTFEPIFRPHFLDDKFPDDGSWIFVGSMGDTFCDGMKEEWIEAVLDRIYTAENNVFLLQTKNPQGLFEHLFFNDDVTRLNNKLAIGTTIETNRDTPWTKAPHPLDRWHWIMECRQHLEWCDVEHERFLSLEPLSDFDLGALSYMIEEYHPTAIEIGLENYTNHTVRPSDAKICDLIEWLDKNGYHYILKQNLDWVSEQKEVED